MLQKIAGIEGICAICRLRTECPGQWICRQCTQDLPWVERHCHTCSASLPPKTTHTRCGHCLKNPKPIEALIAPFRYEYPISQWLPQFKFNQNIALAKWFAGWLATEIAARSVKLPEIIIPTPLHPSRQRSRGYNQAALIAKALCQELNLTFNQKWVSRVKSTSAQSGLSLKERQRNIHNAFAVSSNQMVPKHIGIVDDVLTTGSTIHALAKALKQSGCETVDAYVVAIVPTQSK